MIVLTSDGWRLQSHTVIRRLYLLLVIILTGCATFGPPVIRPFERGVFLFYDARENNRRVSDALLWLDVAVGEPATVTVRLFDAHDRPRRFDARQLEWSGTGNLHITPLEPATVQVILLGGDSGRLSVTLGNLRGELSVRRKGD